MARIGGYGRRSRLLLAGLLIAFACGLWFATPASANCAEMPTDPMCMTTSPPTSPSATNPPIDRSSPTPTPAPINRTTPTHTPSRTPGTTGGTQTFTPPAPVGTDFQTTPVTTPTDTPSIALNGQGPQTGGGTVNTTDPPPAASTTDPFPWGPLALVGLGVAALVGLGAP